MKWIEKVEIRISLYNLATGPLNGLCSLFVSRFSKILFNFPTIIYLTAIVVYSGRSLSLFSHIQQCFSSLLDYVCWMNEPIRDFFSGKQCKNIFVSLQLLENVYSILESQLARTISLSRSRSPSHFPFLSRWFLSL